MNEVETVNEIIREENLWSNGSIVLYHVTPEYNSFNILKIGVIPAFSRGKMLVSWYVNKKGILWAIAHISLKHNVPVGQLVVMPTLLPRNAVKRTSIPHMFYVREAYTPEHFSPAEFFINQTGEENE